MHCLLFLAEPLYCISAEFRDPWRNPYPLRTHRESYMQQTDRTRAPKFWVEHALFGGLRIFESKRSSHLCEEYLTLNSPTLSRHPRHVPLHCIHTVVGFVTGESKHGSGSGLDYSMCIGGIRRRSLAACSRCFRQRMVFYYIGAGEQRYRLSSGQGCLGMGNEVESSRKG